MPSSQVDFASAPATPQRKRIIIACDGTWQSSVSLEREKGVPSNVARLCQLLAKAGKDYDENEWQQIVYYDAGVGTGVSFIEEKLQGESCFSQP